MVCGLVSISFDSPKLGIQLYKTLEYWSRDMYNFDFFERVLGSFSNTFWVWFFEKNFSCYSLLTDQISVRLSLLLDILGNMCIAVVCFPCCGVIIFWNWSDLSNQAIFLHDRKVKAKSWISWEWKELLRWNKKHFSSFLKAL